MPRLARLGTAALLAGAAGLTLSPAAAGAVVARPAPGHFVFVQTNQLDGNQLNVYRESASGALTAVGHYPTGGLGGQESGSAADYLASQGSLVYDRPQRALVAVNAGSGTVTVFSVGGGRLRRRQVISSGGDFPTSVAARGRLVYVLNAGGAGTLAGFRLRQGRLRPIPGSARSLGLSNAAIPNFLTSPGQAGFTPDGAKLLVTTKASGNAIDVFRVRRGGLLSAAPTATTATTPVPFAFVFAGAGRVVAAQAGGSTLAAYRIHRDDALTSEGQLSDGQKALCWIARDGRYYYVANAGSGNVSAYTVSGTGVPALVGSGVAAVTDAGPIDLAVSGDGRALYVEAGAAGAIDEFAIGAAGALSSVGSVTGLGAGIEGIATS